MEQEEKEKEGKCGGTREHWSASREVQPKQATGLKAMSEIQPQMLATKKIIASFSLS